MKVVIGEAGVVKYSGIKATMMKVDFYVHNSFLHLFEVYCFVDEEGSVVPLLALNCEINGTERHKAMTYFPMNISSFALVNGRTSDLGPESSWFMQYLSTVHGINMYTDEFYNICPAFDTRSIEMIPPEDEDTLLLRKTSEQIISMLFDNYYGISVLDMFCIFNMICTKLKQMDWRRYANVVIQGSSAELRTDYKYYDAANVLTNLSVELRYGMLRCLKVDPKSVQQCANGEIEIQEGKSSFKLNPVLDKILSKYTTRPV